MALRLLLLLLLVLLVLVHVVDAAETAETVNCWDRIDPSSGSPIGYCVDAYTVEAIEPKYNRDL